MSCQTETALVIVPSAARCGAALTSRNSVWPSGCVMCSSASFAADELLKQVQTIPLPGVEGRFDHIGVDVEGKRLYVAALGVTTFAQDQPAVVLPSSPQKHQVVTAAQANGVYRYFKSEFRITGILSTFLHTGSERCCV